MKVAKKEKKDRQIIVRVTAEEKRLYDSLSEKYRMPQAVRDLIHAMADSDRDVIELRRHK